LASTNNVVLYFLERILLFSQAKLPSLCGEGLGIGQFVSDYQNFDHLHYAELMLKYISASWQLFLSFNEVLYENNDQSYSESMPKYKKYPFCLNGKGTVKNPGRYLKIRFSRAANTRRYRLPVQKNVSLILLIGFL
jgi:hypothetical protein